MKYTVWIYATVKVKCEPIEATSQQDAIRLARERLDLDEALADHVTRLLDDPVEYVEYADEVTGYLVDEAEDPEYERSQAYDGDGNPERKDG